MSREKYSGFLVRSRAGHDLGEIYLVLSEDERYAYLCDGKYRKADRMLRSWCLANGDKVHHIMPSALRVVEVEL